VVIRPFPLGTDLVTENWTVQDGIVVVPKDTVIPRAPVSNRKGLNIPGKKASIRRETRLMKNPLFQNNAVPAPRQNEAWHAPYNEEVLEHFKVRGNGLTGAESGPTAGPIWPLINTEAPRPGFLKLLWETVQQFLL